MKTVEAAKAPAVSQQPAPPAPIKAANKEAVARKLSELAVADRQELRSDPFGVGAALTKLPTDQGYVLLKENWEKLSRVQTRQQILSGWYLTMPYPLHARNHARLLDVLDLGVRDRSPEVQSWALTFVRKIAFQDFAENFPGYKAWYGSNRRKPLAKVYTESVQSFLAETTKVEGKEAIKRAQWLIDNWDTFRDVPAARQAALDAGLFGILERWMAAGAKSGARRNDLKLAEQALNVIGRSQSLEPDEAYLRRVVVPLISKDKPLDLRLAALSVLEGKKKAWASDLLLDVLKDSLQETEGLNFSTVVTAAARALGEIGDPKVIPVMIGVIDADNTYDTVYGVGYFGLRNLTGVRYDKTHDGAWWRQWWDKNKVRYPEDVRDLQIPKLTKNLKPADPLADVADVPVLDLRAGDDAKKRFFLIGFDKGAKAPAQGYGLLIVLPGGDGSADFNPFIRRIYKNVMDDERWLIAQPVAPKWDENQFNQVVWPTERHRYPAAKFTTEDFIEAVLADVKAKVSIDPRRVILLGWSSGGPPCYSLALRKDSPATGAFIAMSVFRPEQLPALENAKGKRIYLLQSPNDRVTPMQFAEAAEEALRAAGAAVKLQRYEGGHGWRGDVWHMIGDGLIWLEKQ